MPLPKRLVEPVHVARGTIPDDFPLPSELEAATNGTLANTVRQLSSLSRHAEDLFGELARDAGNISERANSLQARIDRLAVKVTQLDSTVEEVSLQDIHMRKAFKSNVVFDQQIFSRETMPTAMLETYRLCDKPPPLDKLNCYRDDGKDGLKFYTDPNYFFELWRQEMLKDTERMMHDRGKKPHRPRADGGAVGGGGRHKKRVRQPHNTRERQRQIAVGHGETIMPQHIQYRTPQNIDRYQNQPIPDEALQGMVMTDPRPPRPNSIELRRSYNSETTDGFSQLNQSPPPASPHYPYPPQPAYDEGLYSQGLGPMSSESLYAGGTPSRTRPRPSQPPPAPPSSGSGGTPSVSCANTPTRGRSMSTGRDALPPPPPPPESLTSPPAMNGVAAHHLLARSQSNSRSGSPHSVLNSPLPDTLVNSNQNHNTSGSIMNQTGSIHNQLNNIQNQVGSVQTNITAQNANVIAQLNSQISNLNSINAQLSQMNCIGGPNDLPPPPPVPEQVSPAPPPPPPPPPLPVGGLTEEAPLLNGEINVNKSPPNKMLITGGSPAKLSPPKKSNLPPIVDPRNDLLKAIRDGIKLRKVEKNSQKEVERANFHDVASILARRVAVEFSDSDSASDSEYDSDGWGEQETSA